MHLGPKWPGLLSVLGSGGSVVVNSLFTFASIVCGSSVIALCFVVQYFVSF